MKQIWLFLCLLLVLTGCITQKSFLLGDNTTSHYWLGFNKEKGIFECDTETTDRLKELISQTQVSLTENSPDSLTVDAFFKSSNRSSSPFKSLKEGVLITISDDFIDVLVDDDGYLAFDGQVYSMDKDVCRQLIDIFNTLTDLHNNDFRKMLESHSQFQPTEENPFLYFDYGLSTERMVFLTQQEIEVFQDFISSYKETGTGTASFIFPEETFIFSGVNGIYDDGIVISGKPYSLDETSNRLIHDFFRLINEESFPLALINERHIASVTVSTEDTDENGNLLPDKTLADENMVEFLSLLSVMKYHYSGNAIEGAIGDSPMTCIIQFTDGTEYRLDVYRWYININGKLYSTTHWNCQNLRNFLSAFFYQ